MAVPTPAICTKCGHSNTSGAKFCTNCGALLTTPQTSLSTQPVPPTSSLVRPYTPTYASTSSYTFAEMGFERGKMIDRTRNGLLLLAIGTILGAIPIIGVLGFIPLLIGVILVILGRKVFGKTHSRNAVWSVGIYILGLVIIGVFTAGFVAAVISAALLTNNPAVITRSITDNFNNFLIGLIIGSATLGIGNVLFTYALQKPAGRILLWAAYAASLALGIATLAIIGPEISATVAQAISGGTYNRAPIDALEARRQGLQLFGLGPALLNAAAYYLAWSRVNTGEIPETPSPQLSQTSQGLPPSASPAPADRA